MEKVWSVLALLLQGAILFGVINFVIYFALSRYEDYREKELRRASDELFLEDTQKWTWHRYISEHRKEIERANDKLRKSIAWILVYVCCIGVMGCFAIKMFYYFNK